MKIVYQQYEKIFGNQPQIGQHILACQTNDEMIVYQAYKPSIADFAIKNQVLGGPEYSHNRMSWIKPNFLWMMYRCGWAGKENQERVLAISINKTDFVEVLKQAAHSSFDNRYYSTPDEWKHALNNKEVRLQWDPDHDLYGHKITRRAIQIGMKGDVLRTFITQIKSIEDITDFVKQQKQFLDSGRLDKLMLPVEGIFKPADEQLNKRIGID